MWQDIKMCEQLNVINNILLSKCWGNKAVFRSLRFFCWSLKKALGKTFMWKCDFNFLQVTLPPHRCLIGNFSFIYGGTSWYSFQDTSSLDDDIYSLCCYWFVSINQIKRQPIRGCSKKVFSLYSENSQEN